MTIRIIIFLSLILFSCAKENKRYETQPQANPYEEYKEGFKAFESGDFFYAQKKFSEAELNFEIIEFAAKASLMSSYCLYGINFYSEAIENLNTHIKKYPADKNIIYAHYLMAIIYFEQIADEKKDVEPLLKAKDQIDFFIKNYPDSVYSLDLKFKKDLIINQIAAKELYVAKYYISVQKWIPAINRLKIIVKDYDKTIFIEEALHRLVEIHYFIGLEDEAKKYASILGYNYNSSQWFEQSYKVFNKKYKLTHIKKDIKKDSFIKKIIKKIK